MLRTFISLAKGNSVGKSQDKSCDRVVKTVLSQNSFEGVVISKTQIIDLVQYKVEAQIEGEVVYLEIDNFQWKLQPVEQVFEEISLIEQAISIIKNAGHSFEISKIDAETLLTEKPNITLNEMVAALIEQHWESVRIQNEKKKELAESETKRVKSIIKPIKAKISSLERNSRSVRISPEKTSTILKNIKDLKIKINSIILEARNNNPYLRIKLISVVLFLIFSLSGQSQDISIKNNSEVVFRYRFWNSNKQIESQGTIDPGEKSSFEFSEEALNNWYYLSVDPILENSNTTFQLTKESSPI